jgi:hypothetical protein
VKRGQHARSVGWSEVLVARSSMAFTSTPCKVQSTLITEKDDDCEVREILSDSVMDEVEKLIVFFARPSE